MTTIVERWRTGSNRSVLVLHLVILVAYAAPLVYFDHMPLTDFPGHVARQYLMFVTPATANPYFSFEWQLAPTLGMDIFVQTLRPFLDIETASRAFVVISLVGIYTGTMTLSCAIHGRLTFASAIAAPFLYSGVFHFGFIQYYFSIGVALFAYAIWITSVNKSFVMRLISCSALCSVLYLIHIYGFGLYLLAIAGYEIHRKATEIIKGWPRVDPCWVKKAVVDGAIAALQVVPAVVMFLGNHSTVGASGRNAPATIDSKIQGLSAILFYAEPLFELPLMGLFAAIIGSGLLLRLIRLHKSQILPLVFFTVAFLAMPRTLLSSGYADYRLPAGGIFFFVAALSIHPTGALRERVLAGAASCFVIGRLVAILVAWTSYQPQLREVYAAIAQVPKGAKVAVIRGMTGSVSRDRQPTLDHIPQLLVGRRSAFVEYFFRGVNGTQIRVVPALDRPRPPMAPYDTMPDDLHRFDTLLILRPEFLDISKVQGRLVSSGRFYRLYDLK